MTEEKKKKPVFIYVLCIILGAVLMKVVPLIDGSDVLEKMGVCDFGDYIEQ